jgi:2'-5' RNA ligase
MASKAQPGTECRRVFCAVEVPERVRQLVLDHVAQLKEAVPDAQASWCRDTNLHLTLKFLGEIPLASISDISNAASRAVFGLEPFSIRVEETGAFPKQGPPRVLWIGVGDFSGKLAELHSRLEDEAAEAGFAREARAFHPHLTVARLRHARHARTLAAAHRELGFKPVDIAVAELLVIRSELGGEGSKYTVISRYALSG